METPTRPYESPEVEETSVSPFSHILTVSTLENPEDGEEWNWN